MVFLAFFAYIVTQLSQIYNNKIVTKQEIRISLKKIFKKRLTGF